MGGSQLGGTELTNTPHHLLPMGCAELGAKRFRYLSVMGMPQERSG